MIVNIKDIPIIWMTCDKNIGNRQDGFIKMLTQLGLTGEKFNGEITDNYNIGVAKEYIKALSKYQTPFLILEDDARLTRPYEEFQFNYNIPDDADAIYLGTSIVGRINNETKLSVIAANAGEYNRIFNMLSFHAVLYISQKYVNNCIDLFERYLKNPIGACDDIIADNMWKSNVLAVKQPIFYQNDGRNEVMTTTEIKTLL